jgi:hypothetical protein
MKLRDRLDAESDVFEKRRSPLVTTFDQAEATPHADQPRDVDVDGCDVSGIPVLVS